MDPHFPRYNRIVDLFVGNKYTRWYNAIVSKRQRESAVGYTEKHHIIPKCLGGSNDATNTVLLTGREHFTCHRLLIKMTTGKVRCKMSFALHKMAHGVHSPHYKVTSRTYETIRKLNSEATTNSNKEMWSKRTPEQRSKAAYGYGHMTDQQRSDRALKGIMTLGKEGAKLRARKAIESQTPDQLKERGRKAIANTSPEKRGEIQRAGTIASALKASKPIERIDRRTHEVIDVFPSIASAERELNIPGSNISNVIHGIRKTAGGFFWRLVTIKLRCQEP